MIIPDRRAQPKPPECKFGAKDCSVLLGYRVQEICSSCRMIDRGTSLETQEHLRTPLHYVKRGFVSKVVHLLRGKVK